MLGGGGADEECPTKRVDFVSSPIRAEGLVATVDKIGSRAASSWCFAQGVQWGLAPLECHSCSTRLKRNKALPTRYSGKPQFPGQRRHHVMGT